MDNENQNESPAAFQYTPEMQDKDATNARSACFRTLRDGVGLPLDTEGKLSTASKALHMAAGTAARSTVNAVEKGLIARMKRKDWTAEQAKKAHALLCKKGRDSYCAVMEAEGYEITDALKENAFAAYEARLIERKFLTEAQHKAASASQSDIDSIFS